MTSARPTRDRSRGLAAAVLVVSAAFGLTGCGTGNDAQTNQQYQSAVGANLRTGPVQLYNALAVDNRDGSATVSAVLLNTSDQLQTLESATATSSDGTRIAVDAARTPLGADDAFNTGPEATVRLTSSVKPGDYVMLTLMFDGAGAVTVNIPVVERTAMYSSVAAKSPS